MLKKNPFLIFILVLAIIVIGGFAYKVFGDRYFQKTSETPKEMSKNSNSGSPSGNVNRSSSGGANNVSPSENSNDNAVSNQNGNQNNSKGDVSKIGPKDCENRCADFEGDNLDYCKEVCGLKAKNSNSASGDCSDKSGLSKDYCLKDLGIEKRDFKFCDQISDAKIKKNCRDRITEDTLD